MWHLAELPSALQTFQQRPRTANLQRRVFESLEQSSMHEGLRFRELSSASMGDDLASPFPNLMAHLSSRD